ncbi:MAG: 6-phospho-3-hexuloisomerase [Terriglobales bacterium]
MQDPKDTETNEASSFSASFSAILDELKRTLLAVSEAQVRAAVQRLLSARRVFFVGAGRSRLALEMAAMRMTHLGLTVYVAGEVVTPAIERGDLLVVASGSGTTAGPVRAARVAKELGAEILALTTAPTSELGTLASAILTIPAADKYGDRGATSIQYGGTLFEQTVLLLMDTLFQEMWHRRGQSGEELWKRHANLE